MHDARYLLVLKPTQSNYEQLPKNTVHKRSADEPTVGCKTSVLQKETDIVAEKKI